MLDLPVMPIPIQVNIPTVDDSSDPSSAISSSSGSVTSLMQSSVALLLLLSASQAEALIQVKKTATDITLESRLSSLKWQHEEQRRTWEWYLR